jgi:hypothetical protein
MFTRTLIGVKAGDTLSLSADYSGGKTPATTGAPASATSPPSGPSPLLIGIVALVALAAILLVIWRLSSRSAEDKEQVGVDSYMDAPEEVVSPVDDDEKTSVDDERGAVPPGRSTRDSRRPSRKSGR